jgi:hypothetical protein
VEKFTKLKAEFDEAEKQHEEEKKKTAERFVAVEQEQKEAGKILEKERKDAAARAQELEREKKRAERLDQDLTKLRTEWELLGKSSYPPTLSLYTLSLCSSPLSLLFSLWLLENFSDLTQYRDDYKTEGRQGKTGRRIGKARGGEWTWTF